MSAFLIHHHFLWKRVPSTFIQPKNIINILTTSNSCWNLNHSDQIIHILNNLIHMKPIPPKSLFFLLEPIFSMPLAQCSNQEGHPFGYSPWSKVLFVPLLHQTRSYNQYGFSGFKWCRNSQDIDWECHS
jgi:hypothetical protein